LAEVISNTTPLQYLHQVGLLAILPALVGPVFIPPAVDAELAVGRSHGLNLPDPAQLGWLTIRPPSRATSPSTLTSRNTGFGRCDRRWRSAVGH
jgi:predicted nucleic acid-binding protein